MTRLKKNSQLISEDVSDFASLVRVHKVAPRQAGEFSRSDFAKEINASENYASRLLLEYTRAGKLTRRNLGKEVLYSFVNSKPKGKK